MDLATISGVVLGLVLILGSIVMGGAAGAFIDIPSMAITIGGTIAGVLITYPIGKVKAVLIVAKKTLSAPDMTLIPWYETLVEIATVARRDGILTLEERIPQLENDFLKRGLQMMVDGNSPETVNEILDQEIENLEDRHSVGHSVFKNMGSYAPAFGMIGTLIGLVQMLQNLSDPSMIGAGMATALLTTFYGALFANLFCIPMQGKLEQRTAEELSLMKMLLSGVLSIQAGDSPRVVGEKLLVYLTPAERAKATEKN